MCAELADQVGGTALLEPEEWPAAVQQRDTVGAFTALSWFRAMRVPNLYAAATARAQGEVALVDSYYDKLCVHWLRRPGMEWLLPPDDPWADLAVAVAQRDWELLPSPDAVVSFEVDNEVWREFLMRRGRSLDDTFAISGQFGCQPYFLNAAEALREHEGVPVIRFRQELSSPAEAAAQLLKVLRGEGLLP